MAPRLPTSWTYEVGRATLSMAGIRELVQATISATNGASTPYTVADQRTRRVAVIHLAAGNGDIRFRYNTAAISTNVPVIPARYFVVDAKKNDTLNFFNTTGSAITVYFVELD